MAEHICSTINRRNEGEQYAHCTLLTAEEKFQLETPRGVHAAVHRFVEKLQAVGAGLGTVIFQVGCHSVVHRGELYMVPSGCKLAHECMPQHECVLVSNIATTICNAVNTAKAQAVGNGLSPGRCTVIMVMDCCREATAGRSYNETAAYPQWPREPCTMDPAYCDLVYMYSCRDGQQTAASSMYSKQSYECLANGYTLSETQCQLEDLFNADALPELDNMSKRHNVLTKPVFDGVRPAEDKFAQSSLSDGCPAPATGHRFCVMQ